MKQREKAAEKYALDCQNEEGYPSPTYDSYDAKEMRECAFMAGARWQSDQSPWISVKDRLPEENEKVFFVLLFRDIHKEYLGGLYREGKWETERRVYKPASFDGIVTHWMPIPNINE